MRYLPSIFSVAAVLSILGASPAFGQAGLSNTDAPQADPRSIANVSIPALGSNYIEVGSEVRYTRTQFYVTFEVILVNNGPALPGVTASVSTQAPNVTLVPGQSTVHFAPVPAHSNVISNDTFTILIDRSVPFDFSVLNWSFSNPVANPGPNQSTTVGSTVTLNGSGSTNPSGIGTLTYNWALKSVPPGSSAVLTNPSNVTSTFVVDLPGTYIAQLTVNNGSASDTATVTITTGSAPPVANAGPNQTVIVGTTVRLDGSKSYDPSGNQLTYSWSLINVPATSAAVLSNGRSVNPTFVADVPGAYIAQLIVNDGTASSQPSTVMVTTANTAPVANAGPNQRVALGSLVQLDGSGSTDVNGNPLTYQWTLNTTGAPGSKATLSNPTSVKPTFTLDVSGIYVAQLIVNDGTLSSLPSTVTITSNTVQPPTANAGTNQTVVVGSTVTLNGTASTDPQGMPLTFMWSLISMPPGSKASLSNANVPVPSFVADQPGTFVAQLIVFDGILYSATPATVTITSTHSSPIAIAGPNQSVLVGATVTLDGSGSTDPQNEPLTYSWSFLNIPPSSKATLTGATTKNPTFMADAAGTYVAQLIVTDPFSSSNPATVTITAGTMTISLSPDPLNLVNSPAPLTITLNPPAGVNPVVVGLSGFDPNVISLASPTVTVPANSSGANVTVTPLASGSTQITANAGGYAPGSGTVNVSSASIAVALANNATAIGLTRTVSGTVTLSAPAPPSGLSVALSADPSAIGQLSFNPTSVSVPGGSTTGTFNVTGVALGSTTIIASASGYTSGTDPVLVVSLGGIAVATGVTVAPGQSTPLGITLSTPAPVGGVTVTLVSSNTNQLTVSSSVFIAQGSTTPATPAQVTGVAIGSPTVTASAGGYSGDTETVTVTGTISLSPPTLAVGPNGTQTININLSSPAPAGGLLITLTSSHPTVATVPQNVTITGSGGSVQVTGVAPGSTTITASTTSSLFSVVGTGVVVTVTTAPVPACPTVSSGEVGAALNTAPIVVSGGTSPYTFSVVGTLPAGLTLNTSTGAITGTPTASGTFSIQVKDANGVAGASTCPFTIAAAPVPSCPAANSGAVNSPFNSPAITVNGGTSPFTFSVVGTLPAGLTLNTSTGAITGTPTATGSFSVQVKDANGVVATPTCTFTIGNVVSLSCPAVSSGEVNVPLNSPALTVTGGVSPYTFSVVGTLPAGLTLNTSNGAITGTPTAPGSFSIQVKDSTGAVATTTCSFTINPPPSMTCPAVSSGEVSVPLNSPAITVNGGISPYTFSVVGTLPAGLTLNTSTGAITGTPTASGGFSIQVKDANGVTATSTCPFTIAPPPVPNCPAANSGAVNSPFNSPAITVNGGTSPYTFSVVGTLPAGLTLNTSTGAITGTPTATGSFSVQVKDANGVVATTTCTFNIGNVLSLSCPAVNSGEVNVPLNSPAMTATGGVSPYTFSVVGTLPAGLTLNTSNGAITGTPTASGTFSIQVKDSTGAVATTTCAFTINPPPTLACPAVNSGEVGAALNSPAMAVSGGVGPYTFSVVGTLPGGLTLNTSNGAITGTPTASGSFSIQVKDANGAAATTTCLFTIAPPPTPSCPTASGEVGVAFNSGAITVTGGLAPYTFSVAGTLPSGLTLNASSGAITGTPTVAGSFNIIVKDANGVVSTTMCPFTIVQAPSLACPAVNSFTKGVAVNSPPITITGGTAPFTFSVGSGALAPGLTLNTTNGAITGTPTDYANFTVQVKDAKGATSNSCQFSVPNPNLTILTTALPNGAQNVAYSFQPLISGGTAPFTWAITGLPRGITGNTSTGLISGTTGFGGMYTVTISVTDSSIPTQNAFTTLPLLITTPPLSITTPAILPNAILNPAMPQMYSAQIMASGGTQPYNWSANTTAPTWPTWLTFDLFGNGSCGTPVTVCGTPTTLGTFMFTITVIDSSPNAQPLSQTFTVTVTPVGGGGLSVSNATVGQGLQVPVNITFTPPVPANTGAAMCPDGAGDPGCVTITSNNPSLVMLKGPGNSSVTSFTAPVPDGTATLSVFVQAVGTAPAGTTATISASFPGYGSATATITYASSGFVVSGPNGIGGSFQTFQGVQTPLTIYAARLDSTGLFVEAEEVISAKTVNVPIASSMSSVGTVSPTLISFSGGNSSATATFTASSANTGTTAITLTQPAGFTTPTVGGSINTVTVKPSALIAPSSVVIGKNLQITTNVTTTGNASQTIPVTIQSLDSSRLLFACPPQGMTPQCTPADGASYSSIVVNIPQNSSSSANFIARAYDSVGSVAYTMSAPNLGMQQATMPLAPSGFMIQTPGGGFGNFSMLGGQVATLNVYMAALPASGFVLESVAGDKSVSADVTSSNATVGTISSSPVVIAGGSSFASTTFTAFAVGSANIIASTDSSDSPASYTSATVSVTVRNQTLSIFNGVTVGQHLEASGNVFLSSPASAGGEPVTLTVDPASIGHLQLAVNPTDAGANSIVVTVPAGQSSAAYWIYALGSSGTATYSASSPDYGNAPSGDTTTLAPSAIIIVGNGLGGVSVSAGSGPQPLLVTTNQLTTDGQNTPQPGSAQALAGNVALTVTLGNNNTGAGTLSANSVSIAPGTTSTALTFTPTSPGTAVISVNEPAGWTMPGPYVNFSGSFDLTLFTFKVQ